MKYLIGYTGALAVTFLIFGALVLLVGVFLENDRVFKIGSGMIIAGLVVSGAASVALVWLLATGVLP